MPTYTIAARNTPSNMVYRKGCSSTNTTPTKSSTCVPDSAMKENGIPIIKVPAATIKQALRVLNRNNHP